MTVQTPGISRVTVKPLNAYWAPSRRREIILFNLKSNQKEVILAETKKGVFILNDKGVWFEQGDDRIKSTMADVAKWLSDQNRDQELVIEQLKLLETEAF